MGEKNCTITLIDVGANKGQVLSILRSSFGISLVDAKNIVNALPYTFQDKYSSDFARQLEQQLNQVDAIVKLEIDNEDNLIQLDIHSNTSMESPTSSPKQPLTPNYVQENENMGTKGYITRQELVTYLNDVLELETQIKRYERMEQEYTQKIESMDVPQKLKLTYKGKVPVIYGKRFGKIAKPEWIETKEYKELDSIEPKVHKLGNYVAHFLWTILLVFIVIYVIARVGFFALLWVALPIIGVGYFGYKIINKKIPISYFEFEQKKRKIEDYHRKCMEKEAHIIIKKEKASIKEECIESVLKPKENAKILLDKLYAKNIIFSKYRNYTAIARLHEYLSSGRCTQLEGPNGAYNIYELESKIKSIEQRIRT